MIPKVNTELEETEKVDISRFEIYTSCDVFMIMCEKDNKILMIIKLFNRGWGRGKQEIFTKIT